ncbi:hypothetical protein CR513_39366, partial [Mucuna pruriens]
MAWTLPFIRRAGDHSFYGSQDPRAHLQAFQTQTYISGMNDHLSCKLFLGMLRGVTKHLEVVDLFDIKKSKTETSKRYLARFNAATGLWTGPFSDSLALSRLASMIEIRAKAEKHVEIEENKENRLQAERAVPAFGKKNTHSFQASHQYIPGEGSRQETRAEKFTPLKTSRTNILKEAIGHSTPTQCQMGPAWDEWREFQKTSGHATGECRLLKSQIEKLIQEGRTTSDLRLSRARGIEVGCLVKTMTRRQNSQGDSGEVHLGMQERPSSRQDPSITFSDEDYEDTVPHFDDPMIIGWSGCWWTRVARPMSYFGRLSARWASQKQIWKHVREP